MKKRLLVFCALVVTQGMHVFAGGNTQTSKGHCCCAGPMPAAQSLTDKSVYQVPDDWTNDAGQRFKLASLAGRPQLMVMFFAKCQYACPLLVYQLQQIQTALPANLRSNIGYVLVSFDPERDTAAALHDYRQQHGLDSEHWTLLRGSPDAVQDLAAVLGLQFKKDAHGQFLHSNLITLLNSAGEIVYQKTGLNLETEPMVQRVKELALARKCSR